MKPKKIVIDIPCPVSLRNVITGSHSVYRRLKDAGHEVVILAPASAAPIIRETFGATVEAVDFDRSRTKLEQASDFITKHLNMTRMQVLGSKYGLRHNLAKETRRAYLHALRVLIAQTLGKWRWFRVHIVPRMHLFAYRSKRPLKDVLTRLAPDLVFLPNPGSSQGEETFRECKRQGIPTVGMVGSWDHPHKRYQALHSDKVFVWSPTLKDEMVELQSYDPKDVLVVGAPHFDFFMRPEYIMSKEEFFAKAGFDLDRKIFTLFSGTGRAPDEGDNVQMLLSASEAGKTDEPIQVFVRSYPGDPLDHKKFDPLLSQPHLFVDWHTESKKFGPFPFEYFPDDEYMRAFVSLFYHSAAILSIYSSASVEASIFRKPSINIAFDGYKERPYEESVKRFVLQSHFDKLFASGAVLDAHSEEELIRVVNSVIHGTHRKEAGIEKLRESVCGVLDGKASERIATYINDMVSQESRS